MTTRRCFALLALLLICSAYGIADAGDAGADFKVRCAPCHGAKGAGNTKLGQSLHVRDLASANVQEQSDADLTTIIARGKGKMPPQHSNLSKEQIKDLVKYIRSLKK